MYKDVKVSEYRDYALHLRHEARISSDDIARAWLMSDPYSFSLSIPSPFFPIVRLSSPTPLPRHLCRSLLYIEPAETGVANAGTYAKWTWIGNAGSSPATSS